MIAGDVVPETNHSMVAIPNSYTGLRPSHCLYFDPPITAYDLFFEPFSSAQFVWLSEMKHIIWCDIWCCKLYEPYHMLHPMAHMVVYNWKVGFRNHFIGCGQLTVVDSSLQPMTEYGGCSSVSWSSLANAVDNKSEFNKVFDNLPISLFWWN